MRKPYTPSVGELDAFVACARRGSTTMAAESLNLTQSAISRSLTALEDRLGVALFLRVRQRLVLSAAGHAFLPQAESLLQQLDGAAMGIMAREVETMQLTQLLGMMPHVKAEREFRDEGLYVKLTATTAVFTEQA